MSQKIDKKQLAQNVARRLAKDTADIEIVLDAVIEEIYEALKREKSLNLRNLGTFYIDVRRSGTVFKFNPAQRLRALFGWSSIYKGDL